MDMQQTKRLCDLLPGECSHVRELHVEGALRRRLLDIGLVKNACVRCVGRSPCRDPSAYLIGGAVIAIRKRDAAQVLVAAREEQWD